uniref:Chromo domain-containing protein n=1 Tax=Parastrongyloides trichosuri TaxID=131310 RepID=A0A0N4ZCW9_PARTI
MKSETTYCITRIFGKRTVNNKIEYLVAFKGFHIGLSEWVPAKDLKNCQPEIDYYEAKVNGLLPRGQKLVGRPSKLANDYDFIKMRGIMPKEDFKSYQIKDEYESDSDYDELLADREEALRRMKIEERQKDLCYTNKTIMGNLLSKKYRGQISKKKKIIQFDQEDMSDYEGIDEPCISNLIESIDISSDSDASKEDYDSKSTLSYSSIEEESNDSSSSKSKSVPITTKRKNKQKIESDSDNEMEINVEKLPDTKETSTVVKCRSSRVHIESDDNDEMEDNNEKEKDLNDIKNQQDHEPEIIEEKTMDIEKAPITDECEQISTQVEPADKPDSQSQKETRSYIEILIQDVGISRRINPLMFLAFLEIYKKDETYYVVTITKEHSLQIFEMDSVIKSCKAEEFKHFLIEKHLL